MVKNHQLTTLVNKEVHIDGQWGLMMVSSMRFIVVNYNGLLMVYCWLIGGDTAS